MRASFVAIGITMAVLSAGCSQSGSPTEPTLSGPPVGPTATTAAVSHDVPFKGRLDGVYTLAFSPLELSVEGKGMGNATQLGQFMFEYHEVVDLSTETGTGTYEFTAANGDTLSATWTGLGSPTSDPNVLALVEDATVTGGTGRFVNASGSFTVKRLFNLTTNSGAGSFEGTIRLR
jgi:hypothetical protein